MELHHPSTVSFVQGLKSIVSESLMLMLPSFLHVLVVSTHVHDDVVLTTTGRTSPTRLGLSSSCASLMLVCASSSRWCSASLAVGRATVGGNGAPRRRAGLTGGGARCQKIGIADGPPRRAGQSAGQVRSCPEMILSLVFCRIELRMVRYWRADNPPLSSKFVQRRCCLWWVSQG